MKRKEYITPFVEFSNIELESDMLAGSPDNTANSILPNDGDEPFKTQVDNKVHDQNPFSPPEPD